jgi:hypothetical protein
VVQLAQLGHLPIKALVGKGQHAVGQVAPRGASSFPSALLRTWLLRSTKSSQENPSVPQGRLGVAGLGGRRRQVETQRVGVVLAQEVGHVDGGAAALAELSASEFEAFSDTE